MKTTPTYNAFWTKFSQTDSLLFVEDIKSKIDTHRF